MPASGCSRPQISRSSVVLPQPEGPSSARISPPGMCRSSACSAREPPGQVLAQFSSVIDTEALMLRSSRW
ncbi:Uncharacterised protein [Bordetella pertussis]|nr:Uncharacterised protein [Bordetella pertussis]